MANPVIEWKINLSSYDSVRAALRGTPRAVDKAANRAINKTLTRGRTLTTRLIREETPLTAKLIRARIKIIRSNRTTLEGIIKPTGSQIPLIFFQARRSTRGRGVTYQIRKSEGRQLLKSAYIRDTAGAGKQVLRRKSDPQRPSGLVGRLPTYMRYGPSVPDFFADILPRLQTDLTEIFNTVFAQELNFALNVEGRR